MPRTCPRSRTGPNVLELLFDSAAMLLVGRLLIVTAAVVLLAGGCYVLGSMAVRVRRGHWLRRAGPFEVSDETASKVGGEIAALERKVGEQRLTIVELETLLSMWAKPLVDDEEGDS